MSLLAKALNWLSACVEDLAATLNRFNLIGDLLEIQTNQERAMRVMAVTRSLFIEPGDFSCLSHPLESPDSVVAESLAECERRFASDLSGLDSY